MAGDIGGLNKVQIDIGNMIDAGKARDARAEARSEAERAELGDLHRGLETKSSAMQAMGQMLNDPASMMQLAGIAGGIMTGGIMPAALGVLGALGGGGGLLKGGK